MPEPGKKYHESQSQNAVTGGKCDYQEGSTTIYDGQRGALWPIKHPFRGCHKCKLVIK